MCWPLGLGWGAVNWPGTRFVALWIEGVPEVSWLAIVLTVAAQPAAVAWYLWSRDRTATFSDELAVQRAASVEGGWLVKRLGLRDAAIASRVQGLRRRGNRLGRWQIPCTVSAAELVALAVLLIAVVAVVDSLTHDGGAGLFVCSAAGVVALFVPLDRWRFRCQALSGELMRPVSRERFVRQFLAAMLLDFGLWTLIATALTLFGYATTLWFGTRGVPAMIVQHVVMLWSIALLLYGTALVTLRLRYWVSWMLGLFLLLTMSIFLLTPLLFQWLAWWSATLHRALVASEFAILGIALIGVTYWRWLRMEVS